MPGKHLLIAEDDMIFGEVLSYYLESNGYPVTVSRDGKKAYELLSSSLNQEKPFDMLITDVQMPELNGLELIQKLIDEDIEIPGIVMSAQAIAEPLKSPKRGEPAYFIQKPFQKKTIKEMIEKLFTSALNRP